jgi:Flp pilus assembly pilin Flp
MPTALAILLELPLGRRGVTALEYAFIAGVVIPIIVVALMPIEAWLANVFASIGSQL